MQWDSSSRRSDPRPGQSLELAASLGRIQILSMSNEELIEKAGSVIKPKKSGQFTLADVGCALITDLGNVYVGVCIDTNSSMGFCAEHNAIGAMITNGEYRIRTIVAGCLRRCALWQMS